jgi:hypothetical protein
MSPRYVVEGRWDEIETDALPNDGADETWPNCVTPDCQWKQCLWSGTEWCVPCALRALGRDEIDRRYRARR